jgi:Tol biopolymer transport system component
VDGNQLKRITEATNPPGIYESPSWSPDGHWITFVSDFEAMMRGGGSLMHGGYERIYIIKLDGTALEQVSNDFGIDPDWSPDGKQIAYIKLGNVCIISLGNKTENCLTNTLLEERYPVWSPDGSQIAFLYQREDPKNNLGAEIYMMNTDGSNRRKVTDLLSSWGRIAWSPDGKQIVFSSWSGCGDIYTVDVITGTPIQLTNTSEREKNPSFSPDGKYIAYNYTNISCEQMSGEGPAMGWDIYTMKADGTQKSKLDNPSMVYPLEPAWSPVPALHIGETYQITTAGANINLRNSSSLSAEILKKLGTGDEITVLEGFVDVDDYYWWRMRTADGTEGWAVDVAGWYAPLRAAETPTLTPTP